MGRARALAAATTLICVMASPAAAWWGGGHAILTKAALQALPDEFPAFFKQGTGLVAHTVYDPDVIKNRDVPLCSGAEYSEHFLDLELLQGADYPDKRYDYIALCYEKGVRPERIGFVPYAVSEDTERLAMALAEHRKWPENEYIRVKALVYAGYLAHYAQDMCQPLHLTVHYNGRKLDDGSVEQKGIHARVDALPETLKLDAGVLAGRVQPAAPGDLMTAVRETFAEAFGLVDRVYDLGERIPAPYAGAVDADVRAFGEERAVAAAGFTSSLYLYAWERSARIQIEDWLDRSGDAGGDDADR